MAFSQPFGFLRNRADSKVIEGVGDRHEVPSVIDALIFGLRFNITVAQLSTSLGTVKSVKALVRSVSPLRRCLGVDDSVDFDKVCMQHLRRRIKGPAEPSTDDFIQSILTDRNGEERKVPFIELFAESGVILGPEVRSPLDFCRVRAISWHRTRNVWQNSERKLIVSCHLRRVTTRTLTRRLFPTTSSSRT